MQVIYTGFDVQEIPKTLAIYYDLQNVLQRNMLQLEIIARKH